MESRDGFKARVSIYIISLERNYVRSRNLHCSDEFILYSLIEMLYDSKKLKYSTNYLCLEIWHMNLFKSQVMKVRKHEETLH